MMRGIAQARSLAARTRGLARSAVSVAGLALYRLSGRRIGSAPRFYRAGVIRERRISVPMAGMTAVSERGYFRWHAQEVFGGKGAIVDLGCGFGSTTGALARGLCANRVPEARRATLHAFDRFIWESWMDPYGEAAGVTHYAPGDSFLHEFEATVAPWRDSIEVHVGDLLVQMWEGEQIELLLVDVMKSWELTSRVLAEFFPSLQPGTGYVIHQDFGHPYTPWIHLVSYRLKDSLVPVLDVEQSETMVFRVARPLDEDTGIVNLSRASFGDSEVTEAFRHSLSITRPEKHSGILAASVLLAVYDGDLGRATRTLDQLESERQLSGFHAQLARTAIEAEAHRDD